MTRRSLPLAEDRRRRTIERVADPRGGGGHDLLGRADGRRTGGDPDVGAIDPRVAHRGLLAWWLLLVASLAVVPEADGAAAEQLAAVDVVVGLVLLSVMAVVTSLLLTGRRGGGHGAMWGGMAFFAAAVACPVTDHHALAPWWYAHVALTAGMAVTGYLVLRASRR
jgi:hypothetical protein